MMNPTEIQRKAMEADYLRVQTDQLQRQLAQLQQTFTELRATQSTLDHVSSLKKGALFSVGSGVSAKSVVENTDELLVDLGARTLVQKKPYEIKKLLQGRIDVIEKSMNELSDAYAAGQERMDALQNDLERLSTSR
ncbi:MAG TPA: prefoldin subunit alpha [Candidatus Norongarragalinales archaeon]|nr:prefoldin subunit alpha [Candidatus Norongarragalinales archaeon]